MKKTEANAIPLALCCLMSPVLRFIPQTKIWSPHIWEIGGMFGVGKLTALTLIAGAALWTGHYGTEAVKRAGAVALPFLLIVLAVTVITGFGAGLSGRFLPLAGTNVITADFLLISWVSAVVLNILKKSKKIEKRC
ncbi:MAG: hypothetical protein E7430_10675 [Ruminococcaceae bacterium]|nr:hypothetical protein [Oscillospiraceae bacterium]